MTSPDLKWIAFIAVTLVALCGVLDFLVGTRGRKRVHELLVISPWFGLSRLDFVTLVCTAASWFVRMLRAVFGDNYMGRGFVVHYLMVLVGLIVIFPFIQRVPQWSALTIDVIDPTSDYIPYDHGGFVLSAYPFTFLSYLLTRYLAQRIAERRALIPAITFWFVDILGTVLIVALMMLTVGVLLAHLSYMSHWRVEDLGLRVSPLAVFFILLVSIPSTLHLLFVAGIVPLAALESIRRATIFVLERVDESGKSPLLVLSTIAATVGGLAVAMVRLLSEYAQ